MRDKTACFTGHRKIPFEQTEAIKQRLKEAIVDLINNGYCFFGAGGALGFDTMAAQAVLSLKAQYPHIRLILVLPCLTQTSHWSDRDKKLYKSIKQQSDKVVYTSLAYTPGCMYKRNRHLIDNSSVCICYQMEATGGTAFTVNCARKRGLLVIDLA